MSSINPHDSLGVSQYRKIENLNTTINKELPKNHVVIELEEINDKIDNVFKKTIYNQQQTDNHQHHSNVSSITSSSVKSSIDALISQLDKYVFIPESQQKKIQHNDNLTVQESIKALLIELDYFIPSSPHPLEEINAEDCNNNEFYKPYYQTSTFQSQRNHNQGNHIYSSCSAPPAVSLSSSSISDNNDLPKNFHRTICLQSQNNHIHPSWSAPPIVMQTSSLLSDNYKIFQCSPSFTEFQPQENL